MITYISTTMINNLNTYKRRLYAGYSKSWYRVPAMARSVSVPFTSSLSKITQSSFYTNSAGASKTRKVFVRSFRSKKLCREFVKNLSKRYFRRFKKYINFRINGNRMRIEYYVGIKI